MVTKLTIYSKTLYFRCILISRFWNVEISLHFNLAFSQCSISIYQAFDGQTEFSRVFNFAILSYLRNSRKFDAREKYVLQYMMTAFIEDPASIRTCLRMLCLYKRLAFVWG